MKKSMRAFALASLIFSALSCTDHGVAQTASEDAGQQQQVLNEGQLDQLVAPIALYPDPLLAQVLMAATYPLEIVQAERFAKANKGLKGQKLEDALSAKDWDASVKALVSTPTVLSMMNEKLDWTEALGDAVLAQQADVMDAIQRLRQKAKDNGKLTTTKQQTVSVSQEADKPTIVIQPASPQTVYVPYYDPGVVYGTWPYPKYPPYYFSPAPGYVVGGALARGIAWGVGFAIGNAIWDNFDWRNGNINVDVNKNVNINRNVTRNDIKTGKWQHNSYHRRGVNYKNDAVRNRYAKAATLPADRKLDYRGRNGQQVVNPIGDRNKGIGDRGNLGGGQKLDLGNAGKLDIGKGNGQKPSIDRGQGIGKPGQGANRPSTRPSGGNAFDLGDGSRAKDFSDRGHSSLGDRGAGQFARPGGGGPKINGGGHGGVRHHGGGNRGGYGGGGGHRGGGGHGGGGHRGGGGMHRGGGGGRGGGGRGGGRGGGGRRSDIRLKQDIVPLIRLDNGLELYRFRYKGHDHTAYVGVMAQEVQKIEPRAVSRDRQGYLRVDYDRIGVKFMTWNEWLRRKNVGDATEQVRRP